MNSICLISFQRVLLAALFLWPFQLALAEEMPPVVNVDKLLTMPYDRVHVGGNPQLTVFPEVLPELDAGEGLIFYLDAKGRPHLETFSTEKEILLTQPTHVLKLRNSVAKTTFEIRNSVKTMRSYSDEVGFAIFSKEQSVSSQAAFGTLKDESASVSIEEGATGLASLGSISLSQSTVAVHDEGSEHSVVKESNTTHSLGNANLSGVLGVTHGAGESLADANQLSANQASFLGNAKTGTNNLKTATWNTSAELKGDKSQSGQFTAAIRSYLLKMLNSGEHEAFVDEDLLQEMFEEYFLGRIDEIMLLAGLSDEFFNSLVVDEVFAPSLTEQEALSALLQTNPEMLKLLMRDFSRSFRPRKPSNIVPAKIKAEVNSILPDGVNYHGNSLGLITSLHNSGESTIYDVVILLKLPAHTVFESFPIKETHRSGYLHYYLPEKELLVTKVYHPIKPKNRFLDLAVFQFDPWFIEPEAKPLTP